MRRAITIPIYDKQGFSERDETGREKGGNIYIDCTCCLPGPSCLSHSLYQTIPSIPLNTTMGLGNVHDLIMNRQPKKMAIASVGARSNSMYGWYAMSPGLVMVAARKHRKAVVLRLRFGHE